MLCNEGNNIVNTIFLRVSDLSPPHYETSPTLFNLTRSSHTSDIYLMP